MMPDKWLAFYVCRCCGATGMRKTAWSGHTAPCRCCAYFSDEQNKCVEHMTMGEDYNFSIKRYWSHTARPVYKFAAEAAGSCEYVRIHSPELLHVRDSAFAEAI